MFLGIFCDVLHKKVLLNRAWEVRELDVIAGMAIRGSKFESGCFTVGSKIIRALEIIHVKKFVPNAVLWTKLLSSHDL